MNTIGTFRCFLQMQYGLTKVSIGEERKAVAFYLEVVKVLFKKRLTVEGLAMLGSN